MRSIPSALPPARIIQSPFGPNPGSRLGPYEILSPSGLAAWAEVYRARDTELNRDVAIKVLPDGVRRRP